MAITHKFDEKILLFLRLSRGNHMTDTFVDSQLLNVLKVLAGFWNLVDQVIDVWLLACLLLLCKHEGSQLRDFQESLRGHFLYTWMLFMHEFIEFLNHGFQKWPVIDQEVWERSNHVHDV